LLARPADAAAESRGLAQDALVSWVCTASLGAYMLTRWIASGGLRQQRTKGVGLPPQFILVHFGLALSGLMVWVSYLLTGVTALAWLAIGLLVPAVGLGLSAVTLWTPYPIRAAPGAPQPARPADAASASAAGMLAAPAHDAVTGKISDATLTGALTDDILLGRLVDDVLARSPASSPGPARKSGSPLTALIPFGHGIGALITVFLTVITAAGAS